MEFNDTPMVELDTVVPPVPTPKKVVTVDQLAKAAHDLGTYLLDHQVVLTVPPWTELPLPALEAINLIVACQLVIDAELTTKESVELPADHT